LHALGLPDDAAFVALGEAQAVLLFVNARAELEALMPTAIADLRPGQDLWVFFRKGSKAAGLDMNRDDVWAIAERAGMRPLGLLRVGRGVVGIPASAGEVVGACGDHRDREAGRPGRVARVARPAPRGRA
jgi:hypothetical protein